MSISKDEREQAILRSRRIYQTDRQSDLATAEDNGKIIGIGIGKEMGIGIGERNRNIAIAKNLISLGIPFDKISLATGLSPEEIARLAKA